MKLYLVRHGQTDWNKEKRLQGQEDIPLNDFGRHLAKETGVGLRNVRFNLCFSSDLKRALETVSLILDEGSSKVPIIMDKRLKEIAFGEWEGKSVARNQMEVPDEFLKFYDDPEHFAGAPGGESFAEVKERTDDFLKWLVGQEEYEDKNILLVTHGVALATLLNNIKKAPLSELWAGSIHKNCAVTEVEIKDGEMQILSENQVYYEDEVPDWAR